MTGTGLLTLTFFYCEEGDKVGHYFRLVTEEATRLPVLVSLFLASAGRLTSIHSPLTSVFSLDVLMKVKRKKTADNLLL